MSQEKGIVGRFVGSMIRRSVRNRFHTVYYRTEGPSLTSPTILYANHNGWMDGYLLFHLVSKIGLRCLDWIEEFDAFPLFAAVGGMRFSKGNIGARAMTVRKTIRLMKEDGYSLILFPEGVMHRPPSILKFGKAIEVVAKHVPGVQLAPVAIRYQLSMHERPEAWIWVGKPDSFKSIDHCEDQLASQLACLDKAIETNAPFETLVEGTKDVNERWDMRRIPKK